MLGLPGAKVSKPMFRFGWESEIGFQLAPASLLCQTPPPALPSSQWLGSDGSIATALTRPVGPMLPTSGVGPMLDQTCASHWWPDSNKSARPRIASALKTRFAAEFIGHIIAGRSQGSRLPTVYVPTTWHATKPSSFSSDSAVPCETFLQNTSSGNPSCVRTTFVLLPSSKNSTTTRVLAGPKFAW
jgi:hypothetical protein